jgi:hypothetical protein
VISQIPDLYGFVNAECEHLVEVLIQGNVGDTADVAVQFTHLAACGTLTGGKAAGSPRPCNDNTSRVSSGVQLAERSALKITSNSSQTGCCALQVPFNS